MRVLLSSVGTRGDVQPIVALGLRVRELGHEVRFCVPPNFVDWVGGFGFEALPVGVEMRLPSPASGSSQPPLTEEEIRRLRESMPDLITDQFEKVGAAMAGCDVVLGANAHQYAARSLAEHHGIPYVNALYAPVAIPTSDLAPPPAAGMTWEPGDAAGNMPRWADYVRAWNDRTLERVNHNCSRLSLAPLDNVLGYTLTDHPWLAADPVLAPVPTTPGREVFETGAWVLEDSAPLSQEILDFLEAGEAPIYFGFGSMPAPPTLSRACIEAARILKRRIIISQGWANLARIDDMPDCLEIGEVNQQALFPRMAAVVHHGGAGTTFTAARAGVPQVVAPMFSDQFYWADRIRQLGVGSSVAAPLTAENMAAALMEALASERASRCQEVARQVRTDGAQMAAERLVSL